MEIIQDGFKQLFNHINIFLDYLNNEQNISTLLLIILFIFFVIIIKQFFALSSLKKRISTIPTVGLSEKVTSDINKINTQLRDYKMFRSETTVNIDQIVDKLKTIPDIKIIRYNPYKDMGVGGDQSFSLSILDKVGNGIILTSLYSREKSRTLIKKIVSFAPQQELTLEEKDLLKLSI